MNFKFFKKGKPSKKGCAQAKERLPILTNQNDAKPQPYSNIRPYDTESDERLGFDEEFFSLREKRKRKRRAVSPPKTPPIFFLGVFLGAITVLFLSGAITFLSLFSRFGGIYEHISVPNFTALTESEAISQIKEKSYFSYEIEYQENGAAPSGTVITQSPKPNTLRKLYATDKKIEITLTVSKKAEPITLPNVLSQDARQVALELKNAGINVTVKEAFSSTVKRGKIISSSHGVGAKLYKNDSITITKSIGKPISYVTVPSLLGLAESEALSILKKGGFTIADIIYEHSHYPKGLVIKQSISDGTSVKEGEKISLSVSIGKSAKIN